MEGTELAAKVLSTWLTLVLGLILLPSAFGVSLGISEVYMKILVKTLEVRAGGPDGREARCDGEPGRAGPRQRPGGRSVSLLPPVFPMASPRMRPPD